MINIKANIISPDKVILEMSDFYRLIEKVNLVETVELIKIEDEIPIESLMNLSENSGSLDFLNDPLENIYTVDDLKIKYK